METGTHNPIKTNNGGKTWGKDKGQEHASCIALNYERKTFVPRVWLINFALLRSLNLRA